MTYGKEYKVLKNFKELVTIRKENIPEGIIFSLPETIYNVKKDYRTSNSGVPFLWEIVKQTSNEVIYEVGLPEGSHKKPIQHEIFRAVLEDHSLYQFGYTRHGSIIDSESKEKWISLLKE